MVKSNEKTGFVAHEKPLMDKFYWKVENELYAVIYVDENWNFKVDIINPQLHMLGTKFVMESEEFESILVGMVPPNRKDTLDRLGMSRYDTAEMLYSSRGVTFCRTDWFAWSLEDTYEEYGIIRKDILESLDIIEED